MIFGAMTTMMRREIARSKKAWNAFPVGPSIPTLISFLGTSNRAGRTCVASKDEENREEQTDREQGDAPRPIRSDPNPSGKVLPNGRNQREETNDTIE